MSTATPLDRDRVQAPASEVELLQDEARDAGAAFRKTFDDLRQEMQQSFSVERIVRDHPWLSVAASMAAGFAVATAVVPRKGERLGERLASFSDEERPQPRRRRRRRKARQAATAKSGLAAMLIASIWGIMQTAVLKLVMAQLQPGTERPTSTPRSNASDVATERPSGDSDGGTTTSAAMAAGAVPTPAAASRDSVSVGSLPPDLG